MTRVILHGANGRMGRAIAEICREDPEVTIVAGVDAYGEGDGSFPLFRDIKECDTAADAVIDFSNASAVDGLLAYCRERKLPLVLCTTGLSDAQLEAVGQAAKEIAVLRSGNMSLGVNVMLDIVREATKRLYGEGFDVEIVEKHHNQKLDAPSGTAIMLADEARAAVEEKVSYVYHRDDVRKKREHAEIGISAVRGGTIVGDHDVIFAGPEEVVTVSHRAYSRAIFARGAVAAAKYLAGKAAGMYDMRDVIRAK